MYTSMLGSVVMRGKKTMTVVGFYGKVVGCNEGEEDIIGDSKMIEDGIQI
ncbi:hypothetical protein AGMMS49921_10410 [Endomicrobiia bacterium]|nr:hypothetical protein AGMMS49921_10410 [Endomicrobiia bacterium]